MINRCTVGCLSIAIALLGGVTNPASGHMAFKKALEKKYPNMKIECEACHVKSKPKTERGEFGKLFQSELQPLKLSDGFKSRKGTERKDYERDVMTPAFLKALDKIKELENAEGKKYGELIETGQIPKITPKPDEGG